MKIPYVGFTNNTLGKQPRLQDGDMIVCRRCGQTHSVEATTDSAGNKTDLLLVYKCGEELYLAGVDGRCVDGIESDCGGEL